jgi:esterase/lipase superfamily enzyme
MLRGLTSAGSVVALGGCASLPATLATSTESDRLTHPTVLIATTRKPVGSGKESPWFGFERAPRMSVARVRMTAPEQGRFTLTSVGVDVWKINAVETAPRLRDLIEKVPVPRDVLIYVHGFNQTFQYSAVAAARLSAGVGFAGETIAFSWPSKGSLLDYWYDRESAMWSRDALELVLARLIENPNVARIHVVAHSIGTMLAMESLRQAYARRGPRFLARIGAVVFAAPDIDMDVFKSSVARIGSLASRITVVAATNDRALAVSGWMAGGVTRVGAADKSELKRLGLHVIDASHQGWGVINHNHFLSDVNILKVIRRAIDGEPMDDA